jgi:hypothetical protein
MSKVVDRHDDKDALDILRLVLAYRSDQHGVWPQSLQKEHPALPAIETAFRQAQELFGTRDGAGIREIACVLTDKAPGHTNLISDCIRLINVVCADWRATWSDREPGQPNPAQGRLHTPSLNC